MNQFQIFIGNVAQLVTSVTEQMDWLVPSNAENVIKFKLQVLYDISVNQTIRVTYYLYDMSTIFLFCGKDVGYLEEHLRHSYRTRSHSRIFEPHENETITVINTGSSVQLSSARTTTESRLVNNHDRI